MNRDEYLEEEIRCDFRVDRKRKALWYTELMMLKEFDRICEIHNLQYFLIAGSMLGAVRHKGFIPWDDDIDIAMLRKDYDVFIEVAQNELPSPYFLQTGINEEGYFDTIVRIRDPRTTGIIVSHLNGSCNNGIFIEVFPYDNVPNSVLKAKFQDKMIRLYKNALYRTVYQFSSENHVKRILLTLSSKILIAMYGREGVYDKFEHWCKLYNSDSSCKYANILNAYSYRDAFKYEIEDISDLIDVEFEFTRAYIPRNYDKCLTQVYRDYMKLPDVDQRGKKHENIVIYDAEVDYKSYIKGIKNGTYAVPIEKNDAFLKGGR